MFFTIIFQVYFLYLNTDLAFRDRNLRDMLKVYHDTFATYFPPDAAYLPDKVMPTMVSQSMYFKFTFGLVLRAPKLVY